MTQVRFTVEPHGRHWAVYERDERSQPVLVVVAVYKVGAEEVARRPESLDEEKERAK